MDLYHSPGGHKGDKDGYAIAAGTDVFISVSTNISYTFHNEKVDITNPWILWIAIVQCCTRT